MFTSARLKLTAWYLLIIMVISITFSVVIYQILTHELNRVERVQRLRLQARVISGIVIRSPSLPLIDPEIINETKNRLQTILILINLGIFSGAGFAGYFLAGKTLSPIKQMMDEQNRFITDASHELRTPITSLKAELEVNLRDKNITSQVRQLLESNLEEVNHLQLLSDNLIRLTQYQKDNKNIHFEQISVKAITEEAMKKVVNLAGNKNITIKKSIKDLAFAGDRQSLIEMLVIFLDNAVKYSNKNTVVNLSTKLVDDSLLITIKDHGVGIAKDDLPLLFNRFYRVDKSRTKSDVEGFGLGLSIAKQIAEKHGGSIAVESHLGKGTTFTILLPV